ncbi:MAG: septum formation protein Maf [Spirochaetales bacterium]|nr:septum formation protein Maf [Spirochaetales bacterium]
MQSIPLIDKSLKDRLRSLCPRIVLASQSPNRRLTLEECGIEVMVRSQDIWEICGLTNPPDVVTMLSKQKMDSYLNSSLFNPDIVAVAADTLVSLDGRLLGKPRDEAEAREMYAALSGRWHDVYSGMSVYIPGKKGFEVVSDRSRVRFTELTESIVDWYISTGDYKGAAGGYRIQRNGYRLIEEIEGSFSNVIGIPLERLAEILGR